MYFDIEIDLKIKQIGSQLFVHMRLLHHAVHNTRIKFALPEDHSSYKSGHPCSKYVCKNAAHCQAYTVSNGTRSMDPQAVHIPNVCIVRAVPYVRNKIRGEIPCVK